MLVINRSDRKGFTLLELMIVVAVMGIMAAVAAPNYMEYIAVRRLNGAARMVMADMMFARESSVNQNNNFRVIFAGNHEYSILDDDNGNGSPDAGELNQSRDIQADYYDVTFVASANPLFYPRGTAFGTTVTLTSSKTTGKRCVKVASTGRVKIDDCP